MYPIEFRDTSAVCLVGNVAFYHSGAVITCDSAVRYSEKHMECFGNVLINKNDTYVHGDRADYNGETHVANVYSDSGEGGRRRRDALRLQIPFQHQRRTSVNSPTGAW